MKSRRECARAGKRTLILEQNDFGSGTSSRSTRIIHGGLRYLEHGELGLVRESLVERERLLRDGLSRKGPQVLEPWAYAVMFLIMYVALPFAQAEAFVHQLLNGPEEDVRRIEQSSLAHRDSVTLVELPGQRSSRCHGIRGDVDGAEDDPFGSALNLVIPMADWSKAERLIFERDMLGLYVSDHPLHGVEHVLASHADTPIAEINAGGVEDGANVTIAGILTAVGPRTNKQGAPWAIATLEDLESGIEVLLFPKTWAEYSDKVVRDQIVVVKGRISRRDDQPSLFASEISIPELTEGPRGPVLVSMPAARCTPPVVERLREVLGSHPGTTEVQLKLVNGSRETVLRLDQGLRVRPSTALMGDIKALLGPTSVAIL